MGGLSLELRCALDPATFARVKLAFEPDPWQADLLTSTSKRSLLNCCRQSGKSTSAAILALHTAHYRPGALVLLGSPSLRQSRELFAKVTDFRKRLDPDLKLEEDNNTPFELKNGSRVVCLSGTAETIRGFSAPDLIIEDEAAFVDDAFNRAVRPMLAVSNGRLILMSTPNGQRGHFHEAWSKGGDEWERVEVPARDCPRITSEFLEKERRALGEWHYRQEYDCAFVDSVHQLFRSADIERAITDDVKPLFLPTGELKPLFRDEAA